MSERQRIKSIKKRNDLARHFNQAKRRHFSCFTLYINQLQASCARVSVFVNKRVNKKAVVRNKMKRWLRELCRLTAADHSVRTCDLVVVAKPLITTMTYRELAQLWQQSIKTC